MTDTAPACTDCTRTDFPIVWFVDEVGSTPRCKACVAAWVLELTLTAAAGVTLMVDRPRVAAVTR